MRGKRILIKPIDDYCNLKGDILMAIITKKGTLPKKTEYIKYKMSEKMARELLKSRKGDEAKMNPNDFLCKIVNDNFGLKGHCVKVIRS